MICFLGISNFLEMILSFPFYCFLLFLCIDHWGRLSHLSLLFFGTLHSNGYIFPLLLCLLLLSFSQLFVRPPQTTILPFCISFSWGWSWSLSPVQCHKLLSIVLQALCLSDLRELPDIQAGFRRGREKPESKLPTLLDHRKSKRVPEKHVLLLYWLHQSLWPCGSPQTGKFFKRWEYQTTWPASWEICMQVRKQQLELDMEQQTGSKSG